jgi:hypothetical protein
MIEIDTLKQRVRHLQLPALQVSQDSVQCGEPFSFSARSEAIAPLV